MNGGDQVREWLRQLAIVVNEILNLRAKVNKLSTEFDELKVVVTKLQAIAQSTADGLVTARTDIADLRAKLATNPDLAAEHDLAVSAQATLDSIASKLPTPTQPPLPVDPTA